MTLAIDGGIRVRDKMLNYGRQSISEEDIEAVVRVLSGDWLTTGPPHGPTYAGVVLQMQSPAFGMALM